MCDTNKLIKDVAFDIIGMVTIWGLVNIVNPDDLSAYINIYNIRRSAQQVLSINNQRSRERNLEKEILYNIQLQK